jgi:hypothetical protein
LRQGHGDTRSGASGQRRADGLPVVDAATLKRKSCEAHEQVEATHTDGTQSKVAIRMAPAASFWHFRFVVPAGPPVKAVTSISTCGGVTGSIPARDVDFSPPKTRDGAPDLGAQVDAVQAEQSGSGGETNASTSTDTVVDPPQPPANHVIFVTSRTFSGLLGTRAGADRLCSEAATSGGLKGEFIALLSGINSDIADEFVNSRAVENMMGEIVSEKGNIWKGSILKPVKYDERRQPVTGLVWTGSTAFGTYEAIYSNGMAYGSCYNWVSAADDTGGSVGDPNASDDTWLDTTGGLACDEEAHLYCISK